MERAGCDSEGGDGAASRRRRGPDRESATRDAGPRLVLSRLLPEGRFVACEEIVASGVSADAEACRPGDVFVARLVGDVDGHDLVERALAHGAVGVVAERMVPTCGAPLCIVPSTSRAHARLAHAVAGDPSRHLQVIAITGTSGKTTTAWLTASVLAEAGIRVGVLSDLGCLGADDAEPVPADLRRPETFARWLRRLRDGGCTHAVVEVDSRMLAEDVLAGVECDTVVVTNLGTAHLDVHGTLKAYHAVKARILDTLGPDGCLVGNVDDGRVAGLIERWCGMDRGGTTITAGLKEPADVTAMPVERSLHGQTFIIEVGGHAAPIAVQTPVAAFVRDCQLAAAVGLRYRLPLERIARGIEAAGSVSGRLERIDRGQDHAAFVDHPTSVHALAATLAGLRRLTAGRLVVLAEPACATGLVVGGILEPSGPDEHADEAAAGVNARFCRRVLRFADSCVVVPGTLVSESGGVGDIMAYARIDRLLASLGGQDCLLVLGNPASGGLGPVEPDGDPLSLAAVVDGWLQLAHVPQPFTPGRRAA